jgi:predicted phage gp36 major capsid-like protein
MAARARAEAARARLQQLAEELEEKRRRELEEWAKLRDLALKILKQVEAEIARRQRIQPEKAPPAPSPTIQQPAAQQKTSQQQSAPARQPSGGSAQPAGGGGAKKGFEALV